MFQWKETNLSSTISCLFPEKEVNIAVGFFGVFFFSFAFRYKCEYRVS